MLFILRHIRNDIIFVIQIKKKKKWEEKYKKHKHRESYEKYLFRNEKLFFLMGKNEQKCLVFNIKRLGNILFYFV